MKSKVVSPDHPCVRQFVSIGIKRWPRRKVCVCPGLLRGLPVHACHPLTVTSSDQLGWIYATQSAGPLGTGRLGDVGL